MNIALRHGSRDRRNVGPAGLFVSAVLTLASTTSAQLEMAAESETGDAIRGWTVFHKKQCAECHAIWGQGGHIGPDLGRARSSRLSDMHLAGIMWNHIPRMLEHARQTSHPLTTVSRDEMGDLFALIFFVRQLDEQGNPTRGERILHNKGCAECHSIDRSAGGSGSDIAKWGAYANPVIWAQKMWEHTPLIEKATEKSGTKWPPLEGSDLAHIVAYARSSGVVTEEQYLRPGSVAKGERLFLQKGCSQCHFGSGPDLSKADLPVSLVALASDMWHHSPATTIVTKGQPAEQQPDAAQEFADILAYILALGRREPNGDGALGEQVFTRKGCLQCHQRDETDDAVGPTMGELSSDPSAAGMAAAMWNHADAMLVRKIQVAPRWSAFTDREMVNLVQYLRTVGSQESAGKTPKPAG